MTGEIVELKQPITTWAFKCICGSRLFRIYSDPPPKIGMGRQDIVVCNECHSPIANLEIKFTDEA